jgi:hypothetical protein
VISHQKWSDQKCRKVVVYLDDPYFPDSINGSLASL